MKLYVDGGCRNNQDKDKRQGYGSWLAEAAELDAPIGPLRAQYGPVTSNQAEYMALVDALEWLYAKRNLCLIDAGPPVVYTDSQLIDGHINQGWKCAPHLVPLRDEARRLLESLGAKLIKVDRSEIVKVLGH